MMRVPVTGLSFLVVVGVALLMVFVLVSGPVEASSVSVSSTSGASWSYGAVKTVSVGPQRAADGWMYEGKATVGYTVTVYDNNTSASTFELTILRAMGAAFSVEYCYPSCSSPTKWVNFSYRAWESTKAVSNFTSQGVVLENGHSVTGVGLLNSGILLKANLTESSVEHLPKMGNGSINDHSWYFAASLVGEASVNFVPSLGLFPTPLTPGVSWTSTSAFEANGEANYSRYFAAAGAFHNTTLGPFTGSVSFSTHGNVTVDGVYTPGNTVDLGGATYPAITLTTLGPFSVREGVVFIPSAADLFGSAKPSWAGNASGATTAEQSTVDVRPLTNGHFDLGGSSWSYTTNSANPADSAPANMTESGFAPSVGTSNPVVSSTTLQGEPETAAQSTSSEQCLTSGNDCPGAPGGSSGAPRSLFSEVVVVGAIATIGVLLAIAVIARWRKIPPPAYLNASLYPPGQSATPSQQRVPAKPGAPPPPEDDPLDHLW